MRKSRLTMIATLASVAAAFAVAPTANAATDYFLEIDGVAGESMGVKETTDVLAFSVGAENSTTIGSASGGVATGKVSFNSLQITKKIDVASPVLFQRLAAGQVIKSMELVARKATNPAPYLRYCMTNVFVTKLDQSGSGADDAPTENVEFVFGSMQQSYARQTATGAYLAPVFTGWDITTNALTGAYSNSCAGSRI